MQSWQMFPVVIVIGVVVWSVMSRGKLSARVAQAYTESMAALNEALTTGRQADEIAPICVIATDRKLLSAKTIYVGVTDRRLAITRGPTDTAVFDRRAVQLSIRAKTFTDVGNMQTTISRGWELHVGLPDGEQHAWRVYGGTSEHAAQVQALVTALTPM